MTSALLNDVPEQAVLGCLLSADVQTATPLLARLTTGDFADPRNRVVLDAVRSVVASGAAPDPITVLGVMRAQGQALQSIQEAGPYLIDLLGAAPSRGSANYYATVVLQDSYRRRVHEAGARLQQAAEGSPLDVLRGVVVRETRSLAVALSRTEATA